QMRATSIFDRGPRETYSVFAVNPAKSEAVEALVYPLEATGDFAGFGVHASIATGEGFGRRGMVVTVSAPVGSNPVEMALDDDWFRNAHLVVVRTTPIGRVVRSLDVPDIRVCTASNGQC